MTVTRTKTTRLTKSSRALALATTLAVLVGAPLAVSAQTASGDDAPASERAETDEERRVREIEEAQARLRAGEEIFLRIQLEQQVNQLARWNQEAGEIVVREETGDLGGTELLLELLLERIFEPDASGQRLQIKKDVKVRPFMHAVQKYMAAGGVQDLEKLQRFQEGAGSNPFADGVPDRVPQLVEDLILALNAQDQETISEELRRIETERARQLKELQGFVSEQLGLDEDTLDPQRRIVGELLRRVERDLRADDEDLITKLRAAASSPRAERLGDRLRGQAEDVVKSEPIQGALGDLGDQVEVFLHTDVGQTLQDRVFDFLESERGAGLRERIESFLETKSGRALERRFGDVVERNRGGTPLPPAQGTPRDRDDRGGQKHHEALPDGLELY